MNKPRHIILLVADSLRYDAVYRNNDVLMPYLAENALQFAQARSGGSWTLPATASMFTGLMPHQHGATEQSRIVNPNAPTLAEQLKAQGYRTYQVTANIATTEVFGLERGFDEVRKAWQMVPARFNKLQQFLVMIGKPRLRKMLFSKDAIANKLSEDIEMTKAWLQLLHHNILDEARKIIAECEQRNEKAFVFLNLMETHFPYHVADTFNTTAIGFANRLREMRSLFHFINQTFLKTGKLNIKPDMLKLLRERQRKGFEIIAPAINNFVREMHEGKDNLVIFCSDHGDNFGEQGWLYHFSNVTDAGNKVPIFYLSHEHNQRGVVSSPVSARDLYSTILRANGASDGISLLHEPEASLPVMQSYWYNNSGGTLPEYKYNQICFVEGEYRYLFRQGKWHVAPISKNGWEPVFEPLPLHLNPLEEGITTPERRRQLVQTWQDFKTFSDKIMAKGK